MHAAAARAMKRATLCSGITAPREDGERQQRSLSIPKMQNDVLIRRNMMTLQEEEKEEEEEEEEEEEYHGSGPIKNPKMQLTTCSND